MRRFNAVVVFVALAILAVAAFAACGGDNDSSEEIAALRGQVGTLENKVAALEVAIGEGAESEPSVRQQLDLLTGRVENLENEVGEGPVTLLHKTLNERVVDLEEDTRAVEHSLYTPSYWLGESSPNEVRRFDASRTFVSLISQAEGELEKGNVESAKVLTHVAIGMLGVTSCGYTDAEVGPYSLPAGLLELVEEDLAPLYTFEQSEEGVIIIHWLPDNPGC